MKANLWMLSLLCCVLASPVDARHSVQKEVTESERIPVAMSEACAAKEQQSFSFEVCNPVDEERTDAPVVISLASLKLPFTPQSASVSLAGEEIPSQLDDLDGDGRADELAVVVTMPGRTTLPLVVTLSQAKSDKSYPARTFAQMLIRDGKKEKHAQATSLTVPGSANVYNLIYGHGPMMESELVGYRIYFNAKQTLDPYGKFQKRLELADCSFYPSDDQLAKGFGDDVLMVGNSCGVGALKGWNGEKATHIEPIASRTERVVASGPVRAILEVAIKGWQYQGEEIEMTQRYLLYAGHRDLQITTTFTRPLGVTTFCTGAQRIMGTETVMDSDHEGLVGSWGRHWPVTDTVKYAKETIGIATYIPQRYLRKEVSDKDNFLYLIAAPGQQSFTYYTMFTSRKETFGFPDAEAWFAEMRRWKARIEQPIVVKRTKNR